MNTLRYTGKRLVLGLIVLFGISAITFLIVRVIPSDPAAIYLGPRAKPEQIEQLTREMGLNKPLIVQYGVYLKNMIMGDWGESLRTHRPVLEDIKSFFPVSLEIILLSLIFSGGIGLLLGVLSARYKGKWFDHLTRMISIFGVSVPSFWIGLVLQFIFFSKLGWLPINGKMSIEMEMGNPVAMITGFALIDAMITGNWAAFAHMLPHYVLPVLTLSLYPIGLMTRLTRSNMLEILNADFIRLARSNGISEWKILLHYALKNVFGTILTVLGLVFSYSLLGSFFVEIIYNWTGMGSYAVKSIISMDYPAIMGVTVLIAFVYVLTNLITDILQAWLDPRITLEGEQN
ncbi:ABC transporter permease [Ferviditalea candida]|uniref:ABC transporter permease n=1 Tax=Ferviditalea candida TaxID=3108399 RepID=A0ABU5ZKC0_9BACL|nr:ABC transporter permease [Paenibacillaceae bacterium T2]